MDVKQQLDNALHSFVQMWVVSVYKWLSVVTLGEGRDFLRH